MSALTDPIADFLTRIRNANGNLTQTIKIPYSRMKGDIARILKEEGYITSYEVETVDGRRQLKIENKIENKRPAITGLKRVSRPGLRKYVGSTEIPRVLGGLGISVLSTSKGVLSGREAKKQKLGGELLAYIW